MDKLSQFVINTYSAKPSAKTAAAIHPVEPTAIEKRAYSRALDSIGQDADFLAKFEGFLSCNLRDAHLLEFLELLLQLSLHHFNL